MNFIVFMCLLVCGNIVTKLDLDFTYLARGVLGRNKYSTLTMEPDVSKTLCFDALKALLSLLNEIRMHDHACIVYILQGWLDICKGIFRESRDLSTNEISLTLV
jgi:hypothetical protein